MTMIPQSIWTGSFIARVFGLVLLLCIWTGSFVAYLDWFFCCVFGLVLLLCVACIGIVWASKSLPWTGKNFFNRAYPIFVW